MDESPEKNRRIAVLAGIAIILVGLIVMVIVLLLSGGDDDKANPSDGSSSSDAKKIDQEEADAAATVAAQCLTTAGNYGLSSTVFNNPKTAESTSHSTESRNYKSRAMRTVDLSKQCFDPTASTFTPYSYKDDASYEPYRITTEVEDVTATAGDGVINGLPTAEVSANLTSHLEFYGHTQGYVDKHGKAVPARLVRVDQTYTDTAAVTLVQIDGKWKIHSVDDLDKIRFLAFQDPLVFHEDTVIGMPDPDDRKVTPVK